MHASVPTQLDMKRMVIADSIARIGGVDSPTVSVVELPATGYRTTVRVGVVDGRPAFRKRNSHDLHPIDACLVAHPLLDEVLIDGHFGDATEVMIRVGARTGERMAVIDGPSDLVRLPPDVRVASSAEAASVAIHEEVAGGRFRISGPSFFQGRADGADVLVAAVASAAGHLDGDSTMVDLYSGVGLFGATVGAGAGRLVTVEGNRTASADARHNLAEHGGRVVHLALDVARWRPSRADVVVADPSRTGLGKVGAGKVVATKAAVVVLVSCDVGSLGRDVGLLSGAGYELDSVTLVDMFPHTHHVEVVSVLRR